MRSPAVLALASACLCASTPSALADGTLVRQVARPQAAAVAPAVTAARWNDVFNRELVVLPRDKFDNYLFLFLAGTRIQISHTGDGVPLQPSGAMSYIDFGEGTNAQGVADRAFDVPIVTEPLSQLAMGAIGAMSGGMFTAYDVRLKVNNLNAEIWRQSFSAFLEDDTFGFDIAFDSGNPTLKCEANTLSMFPFGFPIPVGYRDDTCPDAQFSNTHLYLRFVPTVDNQGKITIADVQVALEADIGVSPIEFLDSYLHVKDKLREGFASNLRDKLLAPDFKQFFGDIVTKLLEAQRGKPLGKVLSVSIDPTGIYAEVPR